MTHILILMLMTMHSHQARVCWISMSFQDCGQWTTESESKWSAEQANREYEPFVTHWVERVSYGRAECPEESRCI